MQGVHSATEQRVKSVRAEQKQCRNSAAAGQGINLMVPNMVLAC